MNNEKEQNSGAKIVPRGVKVLCSAFYNVGSAVEVGQQNLITKGQRWESTQGT